MKMETMGKLYENNYICSLIPTNIQIYFMGFQMTVSRRNIFFCQCGVIIGFKYCTMHITYTYVYKDQHPA